MKADGCQHSALHMCGSSNLPRSHQVLGNTCDIKNMDRSLILECGEVWRDMGGERRSKEDFSLGSSRVAPPIFLAGQHPLGAQATLWICEDSGHTEPSQIRSQAWQEGAS